MCVCVCVWIVGPTTRWWTLPCRSHCCVCGILCVCACIFFFAVRLPRLFVLRLLRRSQNWPVSLGEERRSGSVDRCRAEREGARDERRRRERRDGPRTRKVGGGTGFKKTEYPETDFFTLAMLLFRVAGLAKNSSRQVFCFSYSFIPFYGLSTINCSVSEEQATSANQLAVYYQVLCPCLLHS